MDPLSLPAWILILSMGALPGVHPEIVLSTHDTLGECMKEGDQLKEVLLDWRFNNPLVVQFFMLECIRMNAEKFKEFPQYKRWLEKQDGKEEKDRKRL